MFPVLSNGTDFPHVSRGWLRMTNELPAVGGTIRITGFGSDETPAGCDPNTDFDAQHQTNQTGTGTLTGESVIPDGVLLGHAVDTGPGNSGSPIIWEAQNITVGIHTAGGCAADDGGNTGASFELDGLESAIAAFPGAGARSVDNAYPVSVTRNGTVFRPWTTFVERVNGTPAGGVLTIIPGTYGGGAIAIDKAITIRAPVGTVVITQ